MIEKSILYNVCCSYPWREPASIHLKKSIALFDDKTIKSQNNDVLYR